MSAGHRINVDGEDIALCDSAELVKTGEEYECVTDDATVYRYESDLDNANESATLDVKSEPAIPTPSYPVDTEVQNDLCMSDNPEKNNAVILLADSGRSMNEFTGKLKVGATMKTVSQVVARFNIKSEDVKIFKCPVDGCLVSSTRITEIIRHAKKTHHTDLDEEALMREVRSCPACGSKLRCGIQFWCHVGKCGGSRKHRKSLPIKKLNGVPAKKEIQVTSHAADKVEKPKMKQKLRQVFPCSSCSQVNKTQDGLRRHTHFIHQREPTNLENIGKLTSKAIDLTPACKACGKRFVRWDRWRSHRLTCMKHKTSAPKHAKKALNIPPVEQAVQDVCYPCSMCIRVTTAPHTLRKHVLSVHHREPTAEELIGQPMQNIALPEPECDICGKRIKKWDSFYTHQQKCTDSNGKTSTNYFHCLYCRKKFPSSVKLARHVKMFHNPLLSKSSDGHLVYPCDICGRVLTSEHRARIHMLQVHQSREALSPHSSKDVKVNEPRCKKCLRVFTEWSPLYKHMATCVGITAAADSPKYVYPCHLCDRVLNYAFSAALHLQKIHKISWSKQKISPVLAVKCPQPEPHCTLCSISFSEWKHLYQHNREMHNDHCVDLKASKDDLLYQCQFCDKVLHTTGGVDYHLYHVHNTDVKRNPIIPQLANQIKQKDPYCLQCCQAFGKWKELYRHLREKHANTLSIRQETLGSLSEQQSSKTSICKPKQEDMSPSFMKKSQNKTRLTCNTGDRSETKAKCDLCLIIYQTQEQLRKHNQQHHPRKSLSEEDLVYPCKLCGRVLSGIGSLESHMKSVHQVKGSNVVLEGVPKSEAKEPEPTCQKCGQMFETWNALYRHIKKDGWGSDNHNTLEETEYHCKLSFKDQKKLNRHKRLNHSCINPSIVDIAEAGHEMTGLPARGLANTRYTPSIACMLCDRLFDYEDSWYTHLKSSHRMSNSRRRQMRDHLRKERGLSLPTQPLVTDQSKSSENNYDSHTMPRCDTCHRQFRYKFQLKKHILKAHSVTCDKTATSGQLDFDVTVDAAGSSGGNDYMTIAKQDMSALTGSGDKGGHENKSSQHYQHEDTDSPPYKKQREDNIFADAPVGQPIWEKETIKGITTGKVGCKLPEENVCNASSGTPQLGVSSNKNSVKSGSGSQAVTYLNPQLTSAETHFITSEGACSISDDEPMPLLDVSDCAIVENILSDDDIVDNDVGRAAIEQGQKYPISAVVQDNMEFERRSDVKNFALPPVAVLKPFSDANENLSLDHSPQSNHRAEKCSLSAPMPAVTGHNTHIRMSVYRSLAGADSNTCTLMPNNQPSLPSSAYIGTIPYQLADGKTPHGDCLNLQSVPPGNDEPNQEIDPGMRHNQRKAASYPVFVVNSQEIIVPCNLGDAFLYRRITFSVQNDMVHWYFTQWYPNFSNCKWRVIALLPVPLSYVHQIEKFMQWSLRNRISILPFGSNKVPRICPTDWDEWPKFVLLTSYDTPKYTAICCLCGHVVSSIESLPTHATTNHSRCTTCGKVITVEAEHKCHQTNPSKVGFVNLSTPSSKYCSPVEYAPGDACNTTVAKCEEPADIRYPVSSSISAVSSTQTEIRVAHTLQKVSHGPSPTISTPQTQAVVEQKKPLGNKLGTKLAQSAEKILHALVRNLGPTIIGSGTELQELMSHYSQRLRCQFCNVYFSLEQHYKQHMSSLHKKCTQCDEILENREMRSDHLAEVHEMHICLACDFTCEQEDDITSHVMSDHVDMSTGKFKCHQCADKLIDPETITDHLCEDDKEISLKCNICMQTLPEEHDQVQLHYLRHSLPSCTSVCLSCNTMFTEAWALRRHCVKQGHSFCMHCLTSPAKLTCIKCTPNCAINQFVSQRAVELRPKRGCTVCLDELEGDVALKEHCDTKHSELSHQCATCGQRCRSSAELADHLTSHTADGIEYRLCSQCMKVSRLLYKPEEATAGSRAEIYYTSQLCSDCDNSASSDVKCLASSASDYVKVAAEGKMYRFPRSVLNDIINTS